MTFVDNYKCTKILAKAKKWLLVCWEARMGKGVTFVSIILQGNAKYIPPNGASVFYLYSPTWSCAISPLKSSPTFVSDTHYQGFSMRLLIGTMAFDTALTSTYLGFLRFPDLSGLTRSINSGVAMQIEE